MKRISSKQRFAQAAQDGFNGYHSGQAARPIEHLLKGLVPAGATLLEKYTANELLEAFSSHASYEENCERAYRQINDAVKRLRRVRDAFGRTIGKCR